jgi:hypothetical protein
MRAQRIGIADTDPARLVPWQRAIHDALQKDGYEITRVLGLNRDWSRAVMTARKQDSLELRFMLDTVAGTRKINTFVSVDTGKPMEASQVLAEARQKKFPQWEIFARPAGPRYVLEWKCVLDQPAERPAEIIATVNELLRQASAPEPTDPLGG